MRPPLNITALTSCSSPRSVLNQLPRSLSALDDQSKPGRIAIEIEIQTNETIGPMNPIRTPLGIPLSLSV